MRTITEKYNAVLEGKFSKAQFKSDVIRELPHLVSKFNDFETIGSILHSKGILAEKKDKAVDKYQPELKDPADKFPIEAIERGIDYELEKAGIDSAETHSDKDHKKAKDKALKNLEKDPNFYLHLLSGDSKKVNKNDKHIEVKRGEQAVDSLNGMKKAELNEEKKDLPQSIKDKEKAQIEKDAKKSKGMIKEDLQQICDYLKEKFGATFGDCKDFIMTHFDDITVSGHIDLEAIGQEYEDYQGANLPDISASDMMEGKNIQETAKKKITEIIGEILSEGRGVMNYVKDAIEDLMFDGDISDKEAAMELVIAISDEYGFDLAGREFDLFHGGMSENKLKEANQETMDRIDGLTNLKMLGDLVNKAKEIYKDQQDAGDEFDASDVALYLYKQILKGLEPMDMGMMEANFSFSGRLIKEAKTVSKMSQVEAAGRKAAIEAKLIAIDELISSTNESLATLEENEDIARIVDKNEVKALRKEVKLLEKMKEKLSKEASKNGSKEVVTNEGKEEKQYIKVSEGHCNEIMDKLKERYASEGIKFSKEGKDIINAGHCNEGKMKEIIAELKKEGYKIHESSCNSNK